MGLPKGRTNNLNGRPKDAYRAKFLRVLESSNALERLQRIIKQTQNEDVFLKALQIVLERGLGKVPQEVMGEGGGPISVQVVAYK